MSPYFDKKSTDGIVRRKPAPPKSGPPRAGPAPMGGPRENKFSSLTPLEEKKYEFSELLAEKSTPKVPQKEEGIILTGAEEAKPREKIWLRRVPSPGGPLRLGILAGVLLLTGGIVLTSTVFARLKITVRPKVETLQFQNLAAALDISQNRVSLDQKSIPAELLQFKESSSKDFASSGEAYVEEKAKGSARIYNSFSSSPQTLTAGTRFLSESGKLFRLVKTAVVPGAQIAEGKIAPSFIDAVLEADRSGEEYNLDGAVKLNIPSFRGTSKYESFYATAVQGFSGGFKGNVKVVSADDLKNAEEEVTKNVYDTLKNELSKKIPPDFKLLDGFSEIRILKLNAPALKSRGDSFGVEADAEARALVFRESDVLQILGSYILTDSTKPQEFVDGSQNLNYAASSVDFDKGKAAFSLSGDIKAKRVLALNDLADLIKGQKQGTISELLQNRDELAGAAVSFFPPWLSAAPEDSAKLKFIVEDVK